jgi:hypothetical protein
LDAIFLAVSLDIVVTSIGLKNGIDLKKEKLTDIGFLVGFSWIGKWSFRWILDILINVC